jgi:hypothetical protein
MEDMDFTLDCEKHEQKSFWWRGHGEARQDIKAAHATPRLPPLRLLTSKNGYMLHFKPEKKE